MNFKDTVNKDYRLKENSVLVIDKGTTSTLKYDIGGESRPAGLAHDIRADEFRVESTNTPPEIENQPYNVKQKDFSKNIDNRESLTI